MISVKELEVVKAQEQFRQMCEFGHGSNQGNTPAVAHNGWRRRNALWHNQLARDGGKPSSNPSAQEFAQGESAPGRGRRWGRIPAPVPKTKG
jgi:hypothetical protein